MTWREAFDETGYDGDMPLYKRTAIVVAEELPGRTDDERDKVFKVMTKCYFLATAALRLGDESRKSAVKRSVDQSGYAGFCHRFPAIHQDTEGDMHPSVGDDDWCGEFKPLPEGTK